MLFLFPGPPASPTPSRCPIALTTLACSFSISWISSILCLTQKIEPYKNIADTSCFLCWRKLSTSCSPRVRDSGFRKIFAFGIRNLGKLYTWNLESWALESGIQYKESGIPLTTGIQNPSSTDKDWKPVPGIQYLESELHCAESRIQDCLGFRYMRRSCIERFQSRVQQRRKFIGTKEHFDIIRFNSHRIGLEHHHGRQFIVLETNTADMKSCEDAP